MANAECHVRLLRRAEVAVTIRDPTDGPFPTRDDRDVDGGGGRVA